MSNEKQVQHLVDATFQEAVKGQTAVVDFAADWCPPCRQLAPTIDELAADAEGFVVAKVDVDKSPRTTAAYDVSALPTVLVLRDGEVVERFVGVHSRQVYEQAVQSVAV